MKKIKLRGHHIEYLVRRAIAGRDDPKIKKAASEHLANVFGSEFVKKLESLENRIKPETLVEVIEGEDYICKNLDCPYFPHCEIGDYQAVSIEMMKRVPVFLLAFPILISRTMSKKRLLEEDAALVREYGLKIGSMRPFEYLMKIREKEYVEWEKKHAGR